MKWILTLLILGTVAACSLPQTSPQSQSHHLSAPRSACWPKTRATYIAKHPRCEACGTTDDLEVHHIVPFHTDASKECDLTNLITLCRRDHQWLGHAGSFHHFNPDVRADAKRFREMIANRKENK